MDYILDSSVIVRWFSSFEEEDRDNSLRLLKLYKDEKINIHIPDLAIYEVSNALRYNKNFTREEAAGLIRTLLGLELQIIGLSNDLIIEAVKIAYQDNITVYDSIFVALSSIMGFTLVTANPRHQYSKKEGRSIIMLGDF